MTIARDEVFGPVTCIMKFSDTEEAIRRANDTSYGLASAVYAKDVTEVLTIANQLDAGQIYVNNYFTLAPWLPFAGWKQSGSGFELGKQSIESFLKQKSIHLSF